MSSIAVAADSTQSEHRDGTKKTSRRRKVPSSVERRAKKDKRTTTRKSTKKRAPSSSPDISDDDDDDVDLSVDLRPITGYIGDRPAMVRHMFDVISRVKIRAMLPDIMKPLKTEELKRLCLDHLEVMSRKRILRILDGDNADAISSSGTEDSTDEEEKKKTGVAGDAAEDDAMPSPEREDEANCSGEEHRTAWSDASLDGRQGSPPAAEHHQRAPPRAAESRQRAPLVAESRQRVPPVAESRQRAPPIAESRQRAPPAVKHRQFSPLVPLELESMEGHLYDDYEEGELIDSPRQPASPSTSLLVSSQVLASSPASPPASTPASPPASPRAVSPSSTSAALLSTSAVARVVHPPSVSSTVAGAGPVAGAGLVAEGGAAPAAGAGLAAAGGAEPAAGAGSLTLHQMEIVELEMRARAIKAMLRAHTQRKQRLHLEMLDSQPP